MVRHRTFEILTGFSFLLGYYLLKSLAEEFTQVYLFVGSVYENLLMDKTFEIKYTQAY